MTCPSCQAENETSATACVRCGGPLLAPTTLVVAVDFKPGTLFHERYEILGGLGRGGMGMVYKARDRSLDETVAIKILRPDFARDPRMAERFRTEIRLARRIRHRNVGTIHDYGEDQGLLFISMELIEGVDLKTRLRDKGALPVDEAYDVAIQVAEGLQAVHEAGIIHRDLKTPNIMLDAEGVARLMDFGIAKRQDQEGSTLTGTGQVVGTPEYMSPEQAQGHKVDLRSDIYALGIVLYEIFTGSVPFRGETPISTIMMHLNQAPPLDGPPARRLPSALRPVLRRALAKDPEARFASARELADALRAARAQKAPDLEPTRGLPATAPGVAASTKATTATRPSPRPKTPRLQPWLLVVPILAVAGGVVLLNSMGVFYHAAPMPPTPMAAPTPMPEVPPASTGASGGMPPASTIPASLPPETVPTTLTRPQPTPLPTRPPTTAAPRPAPTPAPRTPTPRPATTPAPVAVPTAAPRTPSPTPAPPLGGLLQIVVRPWGEVSVDGVVVGTTPLDRIPLPAGTHVVSVRHPSYQRVERHVTIVPREVAKLVVDLPKEGVRKP